MKYRLMIFSIFILILSGFVSAINPYPDTISTWYLNDTIYNETGSILDVYGLNNGTGYGKTFYHGENNGATSATHTGDIEKFGGYYEFDGVDDYIELQNMIIGNKLTICSYINTNVENTYQSILSIGADFEGLRLGNNNRFQFILKDDNSNPAYLQTSPFVEINTDYYICGIYDGSEFEFYVDGELESAGIIGSFDSPIMTESSNAISISKKQKFNGTIDEVKIWNRALTQTEIQEEMNANAVANPEGIVAHYSFDDDEGTTVYDTNHLSPGPRQEADESDPVFRWDKGMNFDGVDDYVEVEDNDNLDVNDELTISLFAKRKSYNPTAGLIEKWVSATDERSFLLNDYSNYIRFYLSSTGSDSQIITSDAGCGFTSNDYTYWQFFIIK